MGMKVGMRIIGKENYNKRIINQLGTIVEIQGEDDGSVGIIFDNDINGHDLGRYDCEEGHGWWMGREDFVVVGCESEEFE